jgi:flagella synthesis protein FlgN
MTVAAETVRALDDVIARQSALAQSLLATLEQEREALAALDTESIDAAGTTKLERLGEMETLESERVALLDMHDLDSSAFADIDSEGSLAPAWNQLLQLLKQCRLLNESNGALVASQRRHVQQALTLLSGHALDQNVYGPDGMTLNPGQTTTIATA